MFKRAFGLASANVTASHRVMLCLRQHAYLKKNRKSLSSSQWLGIFYAADCAQNKRIKLPSKLSDVRQIRPHLIHFPFYQVLRVGSHSLQLLFTYKNCRSYRLSWIPPISAQASTQCVNHLTRTQAVKTQVKRTSFLQIDLYQRKSKRYQRHNLSKSDMGPSQ